MSLLNTSKYCEKSHTSLGHDQTQNTEDREGCRFIVFAVIIVIAIAEVFSVCVCVWVMCEHKKEKA